MHPTFDRPSADSAPVRLAEHDLYALQERVSAEFREIPGLMLTLAQAARLFSIDAALCEQVLGALVERGVLVTDRRVFARAYRAMRKSPQRREKVPSARVARNE